MKPDSASATAWTVAVRRAAHQVLDDPPVHRDPLALRMVGLESDPQPLKDPAGPARTPLECRLRAFLAVRGRYAEDALHAAVGQGLRQYVVLGAGLDTFAYRNPYPEETLRVFEVDHPATQAWKRVRLSDAGIAIPEALTFVPVDFESTTLETGLLPAGFDPAARALFSWLGATVYLSAEAVWATLRFVGSLPAGSGIVFDYAVSPSLLGPGTRRALTALAHRVASAGEPFRTFFDPPVLQDRLKAMGFAEIDDLGPAELNDRYFRGRGDELQVGALARLMDARV